MLLLLFFFFCLSKVRVDVAFCDRYLLFSNSSAMSGVWCSFFVCLEQLGCNDDQLSIPPALYNPLDEPSPLGLRLKKSPSLLDLIQMRISQEGNTKLATGNKKEQRGSAKASIATDGKLKASNFPASILKIGTWEVRI